MKFQETRSKVSEKFTFQYYIPGIHNVVVILIIIIVVVVVARYPKLYIWCCHVILFMFLGQTCTIY